MTTTSGQVAAETGRPGSRRTRQQGSRLPLYIIGGAIVVAGVVALSWMPVQRSMALSKLDTFKPAAPSDLDANRRAEAEAAANEWLAVVNRDQARTVAQAIQGDRGPTEAQLFLASEVHSMLSLVQIAERASTTNAQRIEALDRIGTLYDREKHERDRLPGDLDDWADGQKLPTDPDQARALSMAAIRLYATMGRDEAVQVLSAIAARPGTDPARATAALDGLSKLAAAGNPNALGSVIAMISGSSGDLVLANQAVVNAIRTQSRVTHLKTLIGLLSDQRPHVRAIAMDGLGSSSMQLVDGPDTDRQREDLGKSIAARILPTTDKTELAAALRAVKTLRLTGARDAVLALAPAVAGLGLAGIDPAFVGAILGDSCMPKSLAKLDDAGKAAIGAVITKYAAALDDAGSRPIVASALGMLQGSGYNEIAALRSSLDALVAHAGDDVACVAALKMLVERTFERPDVVKSCGDNAKSWQDWMAKDRPNYETWAGWQTWYATNGAEVVRVSAGRKKLAEAKKFLADSQSQIDLWLADKAFVPPLGVDRSMIEKFRHRLELLGRDVRQAFAGAITDALPEKPKK